MTKESFLLEDVIWGSDILIDQLMLEWYRIDRAFKLDPDSSNILRLNEYCDYLKDYIILNICD